MSDGITAELGYEGPADISSLGLGDLKLTDNPLVDLVEVLTVREGFWDLGGVVSDAGPLSFEVSFFVERGTANRPSSESSSELSDSI